MSLPLNRLWTGRLLAGVALLLALVFLLTALAAIGNFAWRQPMFDQLRVYATYITLPFPHNLWQLDNGHRQLVPSLIRVADITFFGSQQWLQIVYGAVCAAATSLLFAWCAWRERPLSLPLRAAGVLASVVAVFWLANSRELMHSHEMSQAYSLSLSVSLAALCLWNAHRGRVLFWSLLSAAACMAATFSYGSGLASFVAMLVLALALRLPWRVLAVLSLAFCVSVVLYLFVLPGDNAVRESIALRPVDTVATAARWISSPWVTGWLGVGKDPLFEWVGQHMVSTLPGRLLASSADAVNAVPGASWRGGGSLAIGLAGMLALAAAVLGRLRRWPDPTRLEAMALGLGVFGVACAGIIALGRLDYLKENPGQIFADRYLVWPCLFWLSLTLLGLIRLRDKRAATAAVVLVLLGSSVLLVTHRLYTGWAATVYRSAELLAAASRSGVADVSLYPPAADADTATVRRTLTLLRERRLAMFGGGWEAPGSTWSGPLQKPDGIHARLLDTALVADADAPREALHFTGVIDAGIRQAAAGRLTVLDEDNRICGYAQFSFIRPEAEPYRLNLPAKRGFDGYIAGFDPARRYRLVSIDFAAQQGLELFALHDGNGVP